MLSLAFPSLWQNPGRLASPWQPSLRPRPPVLNKLAEFVGSNGSEAVLDDIFDLNNT
jgi:hypothetical protein